MAEPGNENGESRDRLEQLLLAGIGVVALTAERVEEGKTQPVATAPDPDEEPMGPDEETEEDDASALEDEGDVAEPEDDES